VRGPSITSPSEPPARHVDWRRRPQHQLRPVATGPYGPDDHCRAAVPRAELRRERAAEGATHDLPRHLRGRGARCRHANSLVGLKAEPLHLQRIAFHQLQRRRRGPAAVRGGCDARDEGCRREKERTCSGHALHMPWMPGPSHYVSTHAICDRLNSARLPFEPTAVTVTLSQFSSPWKVASNSPELSALAVLWLL
jgi:hypothetical protein